METEEKKTNYLENTLFLFLGALCSTVVSLGIFNTNENRIPSSLNPATTVVDSDFDPRVYMAD